MEEERNSDHILNESAEAEKRDRECAPDSKKYDAHRFRQIVAQPICLWGNQASRLVIWQPGSPPAPQSNACALALNSLFYRRKCARTIAGSTQRSNRVRKSRRFFIRLVSFLETIRSAPSTVCTMRTVSLFCISAFLITSSTVALRVIKICAFHSYESLRPGSPRCRSGWRWPSSTASTAEQRLPNERGEEEYSVLIFLGGILCRF